MTGARLATYFGLILIGVLLWTRSIPDQYQWIAGVIALILIITGLILVIKDNA